jgi:SAM-dependent methyltransferase
MLDEPDQVGRTLDRTTKVDVPAGWGDPTQPSAAPVIAEQFEEMYVAARGESGRVPWARGHAHPLLIDWLNSEAPRLVRPGSRAIVVGCGLGDDVVELVERGYDVLGIDIAPTAVRWAAKRYPACADHFVIADLLNPPGRLRRRFDLVVEVNTLQSLPPQLRSAGAAALAGLMAPRGIAVTIGRGREDHVPLDQFVSPPYPFTCAELSELMSAAGLAPCSCAPEPKVYEDDQDPQMLCLRAVFGAC